MRQAWTDDEIERVIQLKDQGKTDYEIAETMGRSYSSVNIKLVRLRHENRLQTSRVNKSTFPIWDKPLKSEGDALIITDLEAPFQHSDFINRCLDLADAWGIKDLHLGGDLLHYDNLSAWGSEWTEERESIADVIMEVVQMMGEKKKKEALEKIENAGLLNDATLSGELKEARKVFRSLASFNNIYVALGNHDDRYLRALDKAVAPNELLHQLDRHEDKRWKIAPYYYTLLDTPKGMYRITHPRNAGKNAAIDLAVQFGCHVIMGHSHRWSVNLDPSARYWAIQTGCGVDEDRLAYVKQRDAKRDAHALGATIIRDGFPFVLHKDSPFDILKRM